MSTRERWTVYPLIFLALGFGFKGGIQLKTLEHPKKVESTIVQCDALHILDANNRPRVILGANGKDGSGGIEILNGNGTRVARLETTPTSAALRLFNHQLQKELILGIEDKQVILRVGRRGAKGNFVTELEVPFLNRSANFFLQHLLLEMSNAVDRSQTQPDESDHRNAKPPGKESAPETDVAPATKSH